MPARQEPKGPLTSGDRFGRYTIGRLLGMGGMGAVYQALDEELQIIVALKVIRPGALRDAATEQEVERRFKRELLLARKVTHPNVVRIHDLGEIDGIKYITMSYVDGTDLATLVNTEGRLPIGRVMHIITSVVSGLVAAHKAGVVHCDLKPSNIMIGADGEVMIMDFGISRSAGDHGSPAAAGGATVPGSDGFQKPRSSARYTDATVSGAIVGTLDYMAPEQARGAAVDHRADIYAAGLITYDLLTDGRRAALGGSGTEQLQARIDGGLTPLKSLAPDVPETLATVVARATHTNPAERFQSTEALAAALAALDEHGMPRLVRRVVGLRLVAAGVITVVAASLGLWSYLTWERPLPANVAVVIADFDNRTGDPAFDIRLEPTLRRALEGASFIVAFDRVGMRPTLGAALPEKLDEAAARELAIKLGLGIVLSGSIARQGRGFEMSMRATQAATGTLVAKVLAPVASLQEIVPAAATLIRSVRKKLGDRTADSDPMFADGGPLLRPVAVIRSYGAAMEVLAGNRIDEARRLLAEVTALDPTFGPGYLTLAGVFRNASQFQDARASLQVALGGLNSLTDREQLTARGMLSRISVDYRQCVRDHAELISRYPADVIGHNQLALCSAGLRDFARAIKEMREAVKILPKRTVFRDNLALYANYAGDFETAEKEARTVLESIPSDAYALLAVAMSLSAQGRVSEALETYHALAGVSTFGATLSASGAGDLAIYEGRFADAVRIFEDGAAADLAAQNTHRAAMNYAAQAFAHLQRGDKAAAVASAQKALANTKDVGIRFLAVRILVEAGQQAKARSLMEGFAGDLPQPQAYARIIEALLAMSGSDPRSAIRLLTEANALANTWIGHYDLGRAYFAAGQHHQADAEFRFCLERRGEALSLFLDEIPTFGYFPQVHYQLGRTREAIGIGDYAAPYRTYLAIREKAGEDPLLKDVRARLR